MTIREGVNIDEVKDENLDELKKKLPNDLLGIIDNIVNFYPYKYVEKIKEILKNMDSDYIINNTTELEHLFYLPNIEEYSEYLFKKIKINKELIVAEKVLIDAKLLKIGMVNKYIENSSEIMKLFLLIYPKEKVNISNEQLKKGKFNFQSEKRFIFKKLESNKKFLKNIKIYETLNQILTMLEGFINIEETEIRKKENSLDKFDIEIIKGFSDEDKVFLKEIELIPEENDLIIKFINDVSNKKQIIKILKEDIDKLEKRCIEILEKIPKDKNFKDKNLESKIQLFLILLEKFKEKNIEKIEI